MPWPASQQMMLLRRELVVADVTRRTRLRTGHSQVVVDPAIRQQGTPFVLGAASVGENDDGKSAGNAAEAATTWANSTDNKLHLWLT